MKRDVPQWLWPREFNSDSGKVVRLGRVIHWAFASLGFLMALLGFCVAIIALISSPALAQGTPAYNGADPATQQFIKNAKAIAEAAHPTEAPKPPNYFDQFDNSSESEWNGLDEYPEKPFRDTALPNSSTTNGIKLAIVLVVLGLAIALLGRGIRYVLSDE